MVGQRLSDMGRDLDWMVESSGCEFEEFPDQHARRQKVGKSVSRILREHTSLAHECIFHQRSTLQYPKKAIANFFSWHADAGILQIVIRNSLLILSGAVPRRRGITRSKSAWSRSVVWHASSAR